MIFFEEEMSKDHSILIIEDDHDIRVCYREALESLRYTIHSATNGQDGLILLSKIKKLPTLIILDMSMPLMGGEEFLKHKNEINSIKNIPVLIVSQSAPPVLSSDIPFIKKPFELDQFISKVTECMINSLRIYS